MKPIVVCFFAIIMLSCKAQQQPIQLPVNKDDNTLLWQISGKNITTPSYLFGTFHILCKDDILLSNHLKTALQNSATVYFEMDLDDPANTMGGIFFMNMKDGKKLTDFYSPTEYQKLSNFFKDSLKISLTSLQKMKPMMLEAMLFPKMMPCKTTSGVELVLMDMAKKANKEIKGFETIAFQSAMFDSIPYAEQAKSLLKDIDSLNNYKTMLNNMITVYKNQSVGALMKIMNDTSSSNVLANNDAFLKNRNINWVKQLQQILPKENIFMAVGAAHLFGEDGLIALLKNEGYTVTPLLNK